MSADDSNAIEKQIKETAAMDTKAKQHLKTLFMELGQKGINKENRIEYEEFLKGSKASYSRVDYHKLAKQTAHECDRYVSNIQQATILSISTCLAFAAIYIGARLSDAQQFESVAHAAMTISEISTVIFMCAFLINFASLIVPMGKVKNTKILAESCSEITADLLIK